MVMVPEAIPLNPKIASTSSVLCAPTNPPSPKISPLCKSNVTYLKEYDQT